MADLEALTELRRIASAMERQAAALELLVDEIPTRAGRRDELVGDADPKPAAPGETHTP